jgi:prolyl oligopeptidase
MATRKVDIIDDYFGTPVADPYRWLEDGESPEVTAWTRAQNEHTRAYLDAVPGARALEARVRALLEVGSCSAPAVRTTARGQVRYFHMKREGTQNHPILYVRDSVHGDDRVLLDPAHLSTDGTDALDWWYPSWDGALIAWGRSESGSEESTLYVRDVDGGMDLRDRIPHTRHCTVAWLPDRSGFYYSRFPAPGSVPLGDEKYFARVYFHRLGDDVARDTVVFGEGRDKTDMPTVQISPCGRWLVVRVHMGWDKSEVYVLDRRSSSGFVPVVTGTRALFEPIPRPDALYLLTNDGAPKYSLFAVEYATPERKAWRTIIPESDDVLEDCTILKGTIVANYLHQASSRLERFSLDGHALGAIPLGSLVSASVSGAWDGDEAFVCATSFVAPFEVERVDLRTGKSEAWSTVARRAGAGDVSVSRVYATSKDGTRIPMFVVEREGAKRDGTAACVLYGYGGFNVNQTPAFSVRALLTVERGGVWAAAVLRGGGEFGEAWHQAGMLEKKQNVFDDFIACAKELGRAQIARPDRIAIAGGSNGGLLVAACAVQRPELFRAGLSIVPLTDMLRYHRFRIGKLWIPEYGSAEDAHQFPFLFAYSPYHHLIAGTRYPSLLFATAESDSRVDPMHARKMAARMQELALAGRPILLRVESKAGHGQGKPISKVVEEITDEMTFLFHELEVPMET